MTGHGPAGPRRLFSSLLRTLAEDLGKQLGAGAHLVELRRTRAGSCEIADAITLEHLIELSESKIAESKMISPDAVLSHLPAVELTADGNTQFTVST
jgi:tRNA pseudouridine55 synthase